MASGSSSFALLTELLMFPFYSLCGLPSWSDTLSFWTRCHPGLERYRRLRFQFVGGFGIGSQQMYDAAALQTLQRPTHHLSVGVRDRATREDDGEETEEDP